jgi:hypothetical protein
MSKALAHTGAAAAVAAGALLTGQARADTVLLAESGLITGSQWSDLSFNAPGPGTITVQLTDLNWPNKLSAVDFSATSADSVLGSLNKAGQFSFTVSSAGAYWGHLMGHAQGLLNIGAYSLRLTFQPTATTVPLPAGLWMLLGGLTVFGLAVRPRSRANDRAIADPAVAV